MSQFNYDRDSFGRNKGSHHKGKNVSLTKKKASDFLADRTKNGHLRSHFQSKQRSAYVNTMG